MRFLILVGGYGRSSMITCTFFTALLIDHLKSFITLPILYCVVVRRFMHLQINESKYTDPNAPKEIKKENAIPRIKLFCLKFLESGPVEAISISIISVYSLFVLFMLTYTEFGLDAYIAPRLLLHIDGIFLIFF